MRIALSLLLAVAALPAAAQALAPAELMQALASVASSNASFVETRHSALLKEALVTRGTLTYRRPASLEKHVRQPYDERIALEGDVLTIEGRTRKRKLTTSVSGTPQLAALVEGIRAVRAGDLATLERHFEVKVDGRPDAWSLSLKPSAEETARYLVGMVVFGTLGRIDRIEVREASGDRAVMEISEATQ